MTASAVRIATSTSPSFEQTHALRARERTAGASARVKEKCRSEGSGTERGQHAGGKGCAETYDIDEEAELRPR